MTQILTDIPFDITNAYQYGLRGQRQTKTLAALLDQRLEHGIAHSCGLLSDIGSSTFDIENQCLANATLDRRIEFANGRYHARRALHKVGCDAVGIPRAADRQPVWPTGYVGSITHSRTHCIALAARTDDIATIGVDMEAVSHKVSGVRRKVLHPTEAEVSPNPSASFDTLIFSAKEAFFKAYYPVTQHFLGFRDAVVTFHSDASEFLIKIVNPQAPHLFGRTEFNGISFLYENHVISALWIRSKGLPEAPTPPQQNNTKGKPNV